MTGDRWKVTMYTYMQTHGWSVALFFVFLWMLCTCVMLNLFVAVILENFGLDDKTKVDKQKEIFDEYGVLITNDTEMWAGVETLFWILFVCRVVVDVRPVVVFVVREDHSRGVVIVQ